MIDIHNHILPGVDDGSDSLDLSRKMLEDAIEEGITDVVITPHYMHRDIYQIKKNELTNLFNEFKSACSDLKINLYLGNELYIDSKLDELLEDDEVCSMNDSDYVLIEFPFDDYKDIYDEYLYNVSLSRKIIIAHPERYSYVQNDVDFTKRWLDAGYYLQANTTSLYKKEEKKVIFSLIEKGKLSFMASDAHSAYRPLSLIDAYNLIGRKFSKETAKLLMNDNPERVIQNRRIIKAVPVKKRLFSF